MRNHLHLLIVAAAALGVSASYLWGQNNIFQVSDGDWALSENWGLGTIPDGNEVALVNAGRIANVSSQISQVPNVIRIGNNAAGATLNVTAGSLTANSSIQVATADGSFGSIHLSGGTLTATATTFLASQNSGATAFLTLTGGTLDWGTNLNIGMQGSATVTVAGSAGGSYSGVNIALGNGGLIFLFDEGGVNSLDAASGLTIGSSSTLTVDGAGYTGSGGNYLLLRYGSGGRDGDFTGKTTLKNFDPSYDLFVVYNDEAGRVDLLVIADPSEDMDGNGLPDAWEIEHFGAIGVDPHADADGDGTSNLMEYLAGTDPNDPASVIRPQVRREGNRLVLPIQTVIGRNYRLLGSTDLQNWTARDLIEGDDSLVEMTHEIDLSITFLRLEIFLPVSFVSAIVLDAIPVGEALQEEGEVTFSTDYTPSGSTWADGLDEQTIFLASMETDAWRLGIGKGGHIYSLRGPFGESVPPQRVESPWNDEAWQLVATNNELVNPIQQYQRENPEERAATRPLMFFLHQSGIYLGGDDGAVDGSFYSPVLRQNWDPENRAFSLVSWTQHARAPNVWKSGGLTFTTYRDLGENVIEVTQVLHNFGDEMLTHLNGPWGGVRFSSLPHTIISNPDGSWYEETSRFNEGLQSDVRDTAGWKAWVEDISEDTSPALSLVFGTEPGALPDWKTQRSFIRYGSAGAEGPRDYQVATHISKIRLDSGETVAVRWYLVLGSFDKVRVKAAAVASHAGVWKPELDRRMVQPVWLENGVPVTDGAGTPSLALFAHPVPGAVPVFLMEDSRSGEQFATLDPYTLSETEPFTNPLPSSHPEFYRYQDRVLYRQYESPGVLRDLLGFAYPVKPEPQGSTREISLPGINGEPVDLWVPAAEDAVE